MILISLWVISAGFVRNVYGKIPRTQISLGLRSLNFFFAAKPAWYYVNGYLDVVEENIYLDLLLKLLLSLSGYN